MNLCSIGIHNWASDCGKCNNCGKVRYYAHKWGVCACTVCGKELDKEKHSWKKDCEKCENCGTHRLNTHVWTTYSKNCSVCGKSKAVHEENIKEIIENLKEHEYKINLGHVGDLFSSQRRSNYSTNEILTKSTYEIKPFLATINVNDNLCKVNCPICQENLQVSMDKKDCYLITKNELQGSHRSLVYDELTNAVQKMEGFSNSVRAILFGLILPMLFFIFSFLIATVYCSSNNIEMTDAFVLKIFYPVFFAGSLPLFAISTFFYYNKLRQKTKILASKIIEDTPLLVDCKYLKNNQILNKVSVAINFEIRTKEKNNLPTHTFSGKAHSLIATRTKNPKIEGLNYYFTF